MNDDFPFTCPAGVIGDSHEALVQSRPSCGRACDPGSYCPSGTSSPVSCPQGSFCPLGSAAPIPCASGRYSNQSLASEAGCTLCPSGSWCTPGSIKPTPCSAGTFSQEEQHECERCSVGQYSLEGSTQCNACHRGSYAASRGQGLCIPCPHRLSSAAGAGSCSVCDESFYLHDEGVDRSELLRDPAKHCLPCPQHATCGWNATLSSIRTEPGHWRHTDRTSAIYKCSKAGNSSACRGGVDRATYCEEGHEGARCEWCSEPGRYYDALSAQCEDCGNLAEYALQQVGVLLAIVVVLALLRLALLRAPRLLGLASSKVAQLVIAAGQFGLQAKCALPGLEHSSPVSMLCHSIVDDARALTA